MRADGSQAEAAAAEEVSEEFSRSCAGGGYGLCSSPGLHGKAGFKEHKMAAQARPKNDAPKSSKKASGGKKTNSKDSPAGKSDAASPVCKVQHAPIDRVR